MSNRADLLFRRTAGLVLGLALISGVSSSGRAAPQPDTMSLRKAVGIALEQNPDVVLARLEEEQSDAQVSESKSPFLPTVVIGSGLAYTSGIPQSVDGSNPGVLQAFGRQFIYNRSQGQRVKEAEQMRAAAGYERAGKTEEVAFRVASTYLDFERSWRQVDLLTERVAKLARVEAAVTARVDEGREIPLEARRVALEKARAERALGAEQSRLQVLEATLKHRLNVPPETRLQPAPSDATDRLPLPATEQEARAQAVTNNPEIQRLEANLRAKDFAVLAEKGAAYPRLDLVAQYSLLAKFNNFDQFFNKFQRHNGQFGMSLQIPVFGKKKISARVSRAELEVEEMRVRHAATQSGAALEGQRLFHQARQAEDDRKLARLELEFARENLSVLLARLEEGRASFEEVERARVTESQAWSIFYDSQYALQKARLDLLRQTGELVAALQP